jgi:hypothetical protein
MAARKKKRKSPAKKRHHTAKRRTVKKKHPGRKAKGTIVGHIKRSPGCLYYVDRAGNVRSSRMKHSRAKGKCR